MDFNLTDQQRMFRDAVATFARKELAGGALARAHCAEFPRDVAKLMATAGLLGITISEADGGSGGALMDAVLAIEEVARVCPRSADVIAEGNFGAVRVLARFGTDDQKRRFLTPVLKGEEVLVVAMTEPDAGSATTDLQTSATADGDGFRISGSKVFPNPHADQYLVYVRYGPGVGGIGSVLIRRDAPGFSIGKPSSSDASDGRPRLHAGDAGGILRPPQPRLDDRRGLDRNDEKPAGRDCFRAAIFTACGAGGECRH